MRSTKIGTVALVILTDGQKRDCKLVEQLSDDQEIHLLEEAIRTGEQEPLDVIYAMRTRQQKEDEEFGDYVENLLSQPFVRTEIQDHGVQWLRSKLRIEQFQRAEAEATQVIAQYAFKLYQDNPDRTDFVLAGPVAKVRIRVFEVRREKKSEPSHSAA